MKKSIIFLILALITLTISCTTPRSNNSLTQNENIQTNTQQTPLTTSTDTAELPVVISHSSYSPNTFIVKKGQTVKFLVVSATGTLSHKHGITIDEFNINQVADTEDLTNPVIVQFEADKTGTFKIYCKTCKDGIFGAGHPDITATLIVQ